jgi:predicted ATPase/DNA-binding SARP family transcriptional activator
MAIRLLGGFGADVGGTPVPDSAWRLRKARAVVKVLALRPEHGVHPERLQELLWPERDPASAGNNLRQALYQARRALAAAGADGAAALAMRGDLLALHPDAEVDVAAFELAAARAEHSGSVADLEAAVAAYAGELLPEDPYEPWAVEPRRALADRHVRLLEALAAAREQADGPAAAIEPLRRVIAAEPLHEPAHRALMRTLTAAGRRAQALEHYGHLRELLSRATAADPEPETRALYRELLAGQEPAAPAPAGPPPAAAAARLPWQGTSFVGRERELAELDRTLAGARLVTLTGPGGAGKTRLALEAARRREPHHADGAWAVELAPLGDGELVAQTVAAALGLELRVGDAGPPALVRHLAGSDLLVVLDNCEHLAPAVGELTATLLAGCPRIRVLATSRAPLRVPGEVDWRVPSLGLADPTAPGDLATLAATDSVRLFCERASAANARFALGEANARAVAEVCWRVDGLPLAIELAAARVAALSPAQVAERLGDALRVLRGARTSGLTRQQTLEATIDWSHELLTEPERRLFRRLSVFAGGFDLEAAEAVADADVPELASLVDQSLVIVEDEDGGDAYRYRLLEPIRQYAAARLAAAREGAGFAERHARRYAALAAAPGGRVDDLEPGRLAQLERDHDNLRAGLAWTLQHDPAAAPGFAAGVAGLWLLRLHLSEGSRWLELALEAAAEPDLDRAAALHARQAIERRRPRDYDVADRMCAERAGVHRALGDRRGEALSVLDHADGTMTRGHFDRAAELAERATALAAADGDPALRAAACERTGLVHAWRHDLDAALEHFDATLAQLTAAASSASPCSAVFSMGGLVPVVLTPEHRPVFGLEETAMHFRRVPPALSRAFVLGHIAHVHRIAGRHDDARAALDRALPIVRAHGDELGEGMVLLQRGNLERDAGDLEAAADHLSRGLALRRRLRDARGVIVGLNGLGIVAGRAGDRERAEGILAEPRRLAEARVDGPGQSGCCVAMADVARCAGDHAAARDWLVEALERFSEPTGLPGHASWLHVMAAHEALALHDGAALRHHLGRARAAFTVTGDRLGPRCCDALQRLAGDANGVLTAC